MNKNTLHVYESVLHGMRLYADSLPIYHIANDLNMPVEWWEQYWLVYRELSHYCGRQRELLDRMHHKIKETTVLREQETESEGDES
jgi:hypothetical protein